MKRTPLKRTEFVQKRKRINPFSVRRVDDREARAKVREIVVARDGKCMFYPMLFAYASPRHLVSPLEGHPKCGGDLVPHELAHSRNVGRLNPDACVAMCVIHNNYVESMGQLAYDSGLLVRGNGFPLSHVHPVTPHSDPHD